MSLRSARAVITKVLISLCLPFLVLGCEPSTPELVFVIAGQSNAVGRKVVRHDQLAREAETRAGDIRIWYLSGDAHRPQRSTQWLPLKEVLARPHYRLGPELGIAHVLGLRLGYEIGLIKVAFNGTALADIPGLDWNPGSEGELYAKLIETVELAVGDKSKLQATCIAGVFWIQGESDAKSGGPGMSLRQPAAAEAYQDNLQALVQQLRLNYGRPGLPVIIASLGAPVKDRIGREFAYRQVVISAQEMVAAGDATVRTVPVDGIERERDGLHYSPIGQLRLGERLGQAMIELLEQSSDTLCDQSRVSQESG